MPAGFIVREHWEGSGAFASVSAGGLAHLDRHRQSARPAGVDLCS